MTAAKGKPRKITFSYYAPQAQAVMVGADFNNWNPQLTPLKPIGKGKWETVIELPPGRYEYRFWVDGQWFNDQRSVECIPNAFGTWNCVLEVHA